MKILALITFIISFNCFGNEEKMLKTCAEALSKTEAAKKVTRKVGKKVESLVLKYELQDLAIVAPVVAGQVELEYKNIKLSHSVAGGNTTRITASWDF